MDKNIIIFILVSFVGNFIFQRVQAIANNAEAVFGQIIVSTEDGEGTISRVSPSY